MEGNGLLLYPYSESVLLSEGHFFKQLSGDLETVRLKLHQNKEIFIMNSAESDGYIVCGLDLGAYDKITYEKIRAEYAKAIRDIIPGTYGRIVFVVPEIRGLDAGLAVEALVEGLLLGAYSFDKYKQVKAEKHQYAFLFSDSSRVKPETGKAYRNSIEKAKLICEDIYFARDLINEPTNEMDPEKFISRIQQNVDKTRVSVEVLDGNELQNRHFNGIYSVGKGSGRGPCMAILKYHEGPDYPSVALVGKGVTLDVGGINLKTSANLSPARTDMAGAATVLAVLNIASKLGLKINVYGYCQWLKT